MRSSSDSEVARRILLDGASRIVDGIPAVLEGLQPEELLWRPAPGTNSIAWLVWHLTRQADSQVADLADREEVWIAQDFVTRFDLPYPADAHGYGMSDSDVEAFPAVDPALFIEYQQATFDLIEDVLGQLTADDYERVIDENWNPPVTLAARLVSVIDDAAKHLGQAEYLRGLVLARRR